ncbi:orotidine 5'-phosphate decarboxylase [Peptococcaceae bacterium CEB3]|nr:orotidine 5'-phosphate decarboxylase [Peptococcaceae bacterium CEB3]
MADKANKPDEPDKPDEPNKSDKSDKLNEKVIVALDLPGRKEALRMAETLAGSGCRVKVGLELYAYEGPRLIGELKDLGFPVFLDLKLHDIPATVERTVRALLNWEPEMLDVHCSGGYEMMARAAEALHEAGAQRGYEPKLLGITVLTSMGEEALRRELGVGVTLAEHVLALARLAKRAGLDGVVASAREAPLLRQALGPDFLLVTPGIRPPGSALNDQARVLTPGEALAAGSSYLVIGRPITRADNPRRALARIWEEVD